MALKIRRGTEAERQTITPAEGELVYTTDEKRVYVGDGATLGGVPIDIVDRTGFTLQGNLDLGGQRITGAGDIAITGNITATGDIVAQGQNIQIGDEATDEVVFGAEVNSDVIPKVDSANDLGSNAKRWNNLYVNEITTSGKINGPLYGSVIAADSTVVIDYETGTINAANLAGTLTGDFAGGFTGDVKANDGTVILDNGTNGTDAVFTGSVTGNVTGDVAGNVTGTLTGYQTGDMTGSVFADDSSTLVDSVNGYVTGNVINNSTKANTGVFGNNTLGAGGYQLSVHGDQGIIAGDLSFDDASGSTISANGNLTLTSSNGYIFLQPTTNITLNAPTVNLQSNLAITEVAGDSTLTATNNLLLNGTTGVIVDSGSGNTTFNQDVVVTGNFTVQGTQTVANSQTLEVADRNIELASTASPDDVTANGGGIIIKGTTDKTIIYVHGGTDATNRFSVNQNVDIASGKTYKINNVDVITGTGLGSGIQSSSLTSVGTLTDLEVTNPIAGNLNGNASTATQLLTARSINGVQFNGTSDITITDNTKLPVAGGTVGALTLGGQINMATNRIVNLPLPSSPDDPATKQYVDTIGSSAVTVTGDQQVDGEKTFTGNMIVGNGLSFTNGVGEMEIAATISNDNITLTPNGIGTVRLNVPTQTTVGAAGLASAIPQNPDLYLQINVNGTTYAIPAFALS